MTGSDDREVPTARVVESEIKGEVVSAVGR